MNEISINRHEFKYVLDYSSYFSMCSKLSKLLKKDTHGDNGKYKVRSLYFDSINNIDYNTKMSGDFDRKKIRLRIYDSKDMKAKLEMKIKKDDYMRKISLIISKEDAYKLINLDYSVLLKYFSYDSASIIYKTMILGSYRPVSMVEYERVAFLYERYNTRITFDMNIKSSECNFDLFDKNPVYQDIISNKIILEVKYNEKLMKFIKDILVPYNLNRVAVSKYCMGRKYFYNY